MLMASAGNIIIDDAYDHITSKYLHTSVFYLVIMALASMYLPHKTIWIATDFYNIISDEESHLNSSILEHCSKTKTLSQEYFSLTILNQVMRCSEKIFRITYVRTWHPSLKPALIHKIQGPEVTVIKRQCHSLDGAQETVAKEISLELKYMSSGNITISDIAVIAEFDPCKLALTFLDYLQSHVVIDNKYILSVCSMMVICGDSGKKDFCALLNISETSSFEGQ